MLATAMGQEAKAFTRAVVQAADPDMIKLPQPEAVHAKAPAADVAGNLAEEVVDGRLAVLDAKDPDAVEARRANKADGPLFARRVRHVSKGRS